MIRSSIFGSLNYVPTETFKGKPPSLKCPNYQT